MRQFMRALRWVWPPLALAGAGVLLWHNSDPSAVPWYLPGMDYFTEGRKVDAGRLSWQSLVGFGVFTLGYAVWMYLIEAPETDIEAIGGKPQGMGSGKDVTFGDADLDRLVAWEEPPKRRGADDDLVKYD